MNLPAPKTGQAHITSNSAAKKADAAFRSHCTPQPPNFPLQALEPLALAVVSPDRSPSSAVRNEPQLTKRPLLHVSFAICMQARHNT
jgi:hypothetical protein